MSGDSALALMPDVFVTSDAGAVGELAALCVKGKPANMHQDCMRMRTNETGKHTRTDVVHVHVTGGNIQSSGTRKRISFTGFLTLLRLLN